jgi:hypothetical protein
MGLAEQICDYYKGEKTRRRDFLTKQDCGHTICDSCFDAPMGKVREVLYIGDIRCPVCEERDAIEQLGALLAKLNSES